jgi:hypothetical protein
VDGATGSVLDANDDVHHATGFPERPATGDTLQTILRLGRSRLVRVLRCPHVVAENDEGLRQPDDRAAATPAVEPRGPNAAPTDRRGGNEAGISGTPTFFVNGYVVSGAQPFSKFKKVIDRAMSEPKP